MPESQRHTESRGQFTDGRMEAIAGGVQARLEERTGYAGKITDETIKTARALGVAEREIEKWVNQRVKQLARDEARLKGIKARLNRLGGKSYV